MLASRSMRKVVGLQNYGRIARCAMGIGLVWLGLASASQAAPPAPILHEPLPPGGPQRARSDRVVGPGTPGSLPAAIETAAGKIERPAPATPGDDTPVYRPAPPPRIGLDRRTGADGQLHYQMVFDPSVAPFKRELAFDTVQPDVTLAQSGRGRRALPPGPQPPRSGHELFWGHIKLVLTPGQRAVLPSVAPTSRILQWQASPARSLEFFRDDAGNFTVQAQVGGEVDLRFLMDAPSTYFAAPLGTQRRRDDPEQPRLDPALQARAEALWPALGVDAHMERSAALTRLAEWFRAFEPGAPPLAGQDALADLVLGQKGVCRHRALGFVVIAHSLGIACHYVMNDAHAFLEVWAPHEGGNGAWQRLDLGGGADTLELHSAHDKHLHQPAFRDPFPQPPAFAGQTGTVLADGRVLQTGMAGAKKVKGSEQLAGAGGAAAPSLARPGAAQAEGSGSAGDRREGAAESRRAWLAQRAARLAAVPPGPGSAPEPRPAGRPDPRRPTTTTLNKAAPMAYVGEPLEVQGALRAPGGKVARQTIELWLIDPAQPLRGLLVGVAITDATGLFAARLAIPGDAGLGVHDLIARYPGNAAQLPSDSSAR